MSTRSQIQFISIYYDDEGEEARGEVAQVYRHSDGYPEGVLSSLRDLYEVLESTGCGRGATYDAANFILLNKLRSMRFYMEDNEDFDPVDPDTWGNQPFFLLGYGVEDPNAGIHGDEEYLYQVIDKIRPREPHSMDYNREREVRITDHRGFPSWDDDGVDEAFEEARWQFEGTLEEALEEFVEEDE